MLGVLQVPLMALKGLLCQQLQHTPGAARPPAQPPACPPAQLPARLPACLRRLTSFTKYFITS